MRGVTTVSGLVLSLLATRVRGGPIPSQPDESCTNGWCSWSTGDGETQAYANLIVNAAPNALSDITGAAGWKVDGCPTDWKDGETKVTLTCADASKCSHLFNGGAEDTLVRLPTECGKGPFARVMECNKIGNKKRGSSDGGAITNGMQWSATISFDLNSKPPDESKGPVMMYLTGSNIKGAADTLNKRWVQEHHMKRGLSQELDRRSLFGSIGNAIKSTVSKAADGVKTAASDVKKAGQAVVSDVKKAGQAVATDAKKAEQAVATKAKQAVKAVETDVKKVADATVNGVKKAAAAVQKDTTFNKTETEKIKPVTIQKNFPIFDKSLSCGNINADLNMNVDATLNANVGFGYTLIGSVIPPKIQDLSVQATLNGNVDATFNIGVGIQGSFDTGLITLVNVPLTPLEIPGIGSIGPVVSVGTELTAQMDIEAQMAVNTAFSLPDINLVFPPDNGKSSGGGTKQVVPKQPLKVSVGDGKVTANGDIDAHLIPRVDFGIELLKLAKATVFLELDASGTLSMTVEGDSTVTPPPSAREVATIDPPPQVAADSTTAVEVAPELTPAEKRARTNTVSGSVSLDGSIFMQGGLDGSIGPFAKSLNFPIFTFTKNIFTKNFGTPAATGRRDLLALPAGLESRAATAKGKAAPAPAKKPAAVKETPAAKDAKKPAPAAKSKQKTSLNCFSSGSLLGGGGVKGFLSSLIPVPL